jgi:hypothetical protein
VKKRPELRDVGSQSDCHSYRSLVGLANEVANPPTHSFSSTDRAVGSAAALYTKTAAQTAQARQLYNASADTYYKTNDAVAYDDWVRARNHWDYFYNWSVAWSCIVGFRFLWR